MSEYIIKQMETDDEIRGKAYVHYKSWQESYTGLVDDGYLSAMTIDKCTDIAYKYRDNIIVAVDKRTGRVIGFTAYGAYRSDSLAGYGEVYAIYVLKEYIGKKVGYNLMNAAFKELSEYGKIAVWVLKGNDRAISFYKRYGFDFDGETAEIMLGRPNTELRMIYKR